MNAIEQAQADILRQAKAAKRSKLEDELAYQLRVAGIKHKQQFAFAPGRKYRADFALPNGILIECQGGQWVKGRHTRGGKAYERECRRLNAGTLLGYRWLWFVGDQITSGEAITIIEAALREAAMARHMEEL